MMIWFTAKETRRRKVSLILPSKERINKKETRYIIIRYINTRYNRIINYNLSIFINKYI